MRSLFRSLFKTVLFALLLFTGSITSQVNNWIEVENIIGKTGKISGDVLRITFPRTDLDVTVDGNKIDPAMALTAWVAIDAMENEALLLCNLVLKEEEVDDVVDAVVKNDLQINAMHNHLIGESPRLIYVSIGGTGTPVELAQKIKSVIEETNIPVESDSIGSASEKVDWSDIQSGFGINGDSNGFVLKLTIPRQETITMNGNELPFALGVATNLNFQRFGEKIISTGVFVLTADEINPVIKALTESGIKITSVNSLLVTETPHMYFMHYWAYDFPENVLDGLKTALDLTNSNY